MCTRCGNELSREDKKRIYILYTAKVDACNARLRITAGISTVRDLSVLVPRPDMDAGVRIRRLNRFHRLVCYHGNDNQSIARIQIMIKEDSRVYHKLRGTQEETRKQVLSAMLEV
jgi:hypothetical protein